MLLPLLKCLTWLIHDSSKRLNEIKQKLTWLEIKTKKEKNRVHTPNALASLVLPTHVLDYYVWNDTVLLFSFKAWLGRGEDC
jgi:hypothetical protein